MEFGGRVNLAVCRIQRGGVVGFCRSPACMNSDRSSTHFTQVYAGQMFDLTFPKYKDYYTTIIRIQSSNYLFLSLRVWQILYKAQILFPVSPLSSSSSMPRRPAIPCYIRPLVFTRSIYAVQGLFVSSCI